jgi:lysophospholipase L1-like esterase
MFYGSVALNVDSSGRVASTQPHGTTGPEAGMEWVTDSPLFALIGTFGLTGFRLWVNGEQVYELPTGSPFSNGYGYIDWSGVRRMRHYRLLAGNGLNVSGFACDAADTFYAPTHRRAIKLGWLGDSYSQGNQSLPWLTGRLLGWTIPLNSTDGGTGFITAGSGQPFTARVADIVAANPDVVVVAGGINDPLSGLQTGVTTVLQGIRTGLPNAPIFVVGPWCPPGSPYSAQVAKYAAIQAAAAAVSGCTFIDPRTWWTGTGNSGSRTVIDAVLNSTTTITSATAAFTAADAGVYITGAGIPSGAKIASVTNSATAVLTAAATSSASGATVTITAQKGDGNADVYINPDNTHPNPAGYQYLASRLASAILATLPY